MGSMSYDYTFHYEITGVYVYLLHVHWNSEPSASTHAATQTFLICA